jgi:hypothetical protein
MAFALEGPQSLDSSTLKFIAFRGKFVQKLVEFFVVRAY